jgi:hypothetical protein
VQSREIVEEEALHHLLIWNHQIAQYVIKARYSTVVWVLEPWDQKVDHAGKYVALIASHSTVGAYGQYGNRQSCLVSCIVQQCVCERVLRELRAPVLCHRD